MLKIWSRKNSINVQNVLRCCEALGLQYERIDAGGPSGLTRDPEYLGLNPNGLVPTISCRHLPYSPAASSPSTRTPRESRFTPQPGNTTVLTTNG